MRFKSRRGAELVEMALVMPILVVLVFGTIDFGLALFNKAVLTNAAREGARAAVVFRNPTLDPTTPQEAAEEAVNTYCTSYLISSGSTTPTITTTVNPLAANAEAVEVTVDFTYNYLAVAGLLGLDPLPMQGRSVMRRE